MYEANPLTYLDSHNEQNVFIPGVFCSQKAIYLSLSNPDNSFISMMQIVNEKRFNDYMYVSTVCGNHVEFRLLSGGVKGCGFKPAV